MTNKKIVLLAAQDTGTNIVYNHINKAFGIDKVIIEQKESKKIFIKRRIKRLGLLKVIGQILFQLLVAKPQGLLSKKRIQSILQNEELDASPIDSSKIIHVPSVNSKQVLEFLRETKPDLVLVNGTRIISKKILSAVDCKFINTHTGITPKYRGVHGTYWALVNNDIANSGVTVHFVDEGIDTGNIIYQDTVEPGPQDNFSTYPLLQIAKGVRLLKQAVDDYFDGSIIIKTNNNESKLWYHPTLLEYIYNRIIHKVK